jgi:hypothetical protein
MAEVTVRQALQHVADHPELDTDVLLDVRVHELISRTLFEVANTPDGSVRGGLSRANKARRMLMDRLVGKRAPGTAPAAKTVDEVEFVDLTQGALEG